MVLKDAYYSMEDKYYEIIEKVSQTIPINKVTDTIDQFVPSFMVLIAIIILLLIGGVYLLTGTGLGEEKDLSFKIINEDGQGLSYAEIKVIINDENTQLLTTTAFGTTKSIKVPLNSMVTYTIEETNYKKKSDSFKFTEEGEKVITLELLGQGETQGKTRTIKLYDKENPSELISGTTYTVSFSCSNPEATPPSNITIYNGQGEVFEPADCGTLKAYVTGNHSESVTIELTDSTNSIYLDSLIQKNTLTVDVEDTEGRALNGIRVKVYEIYENSENSVYVDSSTTYSGQTSFELSAGEYIIKTVDDTGVYYPAEKTVYMTDNDKRVTLILDEVDLSNPDTGTIKIRVLDEDTQAELPETTITLYYEDGTVFEDRITDDNGTAEFYVRDKETEFDAVIDNEQYIVKRTTGWTADNTTRTVQLEKFTGNNAGKLKVRAITVQGTKEKPVRNAKIALYTVEDDEIFLTGVSEKITDENGYAEFKKIKNGTYKAFAYKGTSSGWSDELLYDQRKQDEVELVATMLIPDGTINLQILDQEENAIPFATITFFEEGTLKQLKADKTDSNGSIEFKTRGDKKVYFKVEKPDFMDYYSLRYPIFGEVIINEKIIMIPEKRLETPEINLIGLYLEDEFLSEVSSLEQGQEYTVKLQLLVPENKNYEEAGIHFRVGNDIFMENDFILIKTINAPKTITTKYTMFDSDNLNDSKKSNTQGDAKWFNSVWLLPKAGVYAVEAKIKVKENALSGQELKLKFRAYGKTGSKYYRDPTDVSISSVNALNAATKEKTFTIGTNILCSEKFCFKATITDLKEDIKKNVSRTYSTKILQKYRLEFDVLNNDKETKHYNARIQLNNENEMLNFLDYTLKNADALTRNGYADEEKTPWIDLGDFNPNTHITGKADFITQETKTGTILIQIVSNQEIVFEKEIELDVQAPKNFELEYTPELIPSTSSSLIEFTVFDEETGIEVKDAQIKVLDRFRDVIAGPDLTDKKGKVVIEIPGQAPDTKLIFRIEKEEYQLYEQEIFTDGNIVKITPERIGIALNTKTKTNETFELTIKNLLEFDLELSSLEFTGEDRDLLDIRAMNAWMKTNYGNIIIPSKTTKEIQAKAIISNYGIQREERDTVDLDLELELINSQAVWTKEIPAKISIGVGGEVDDPNCLTVEAREWKTATEGTKVKIDFGIENACTINGEPIQLRDLEAKVNWNSNHIGTYTLTFEGSDIELRSAYYRKLEGVMENRKYTATLAFEPNGGVNGDAIAEINIRARNRLDGKDEFIEDSIQTEIKIVNLDDCIKISNTEIKIKKGETGTFNLSTLGCGSNVNFTLDSDIKLSSSSLTLGPEETGPEITIDSTGALVGRYVIKTDAKGASNATKIEIPNVFVTIYEDSCIQLSRYEFDIYDDPDQEFDGYDTAQLFNYCYEKEVPVTIEMKDWSTAMRKSLVPAVIAFSFSMLTQKDNEENPEEETEIDKLKNKIKELEEEIRDLKDRAKRSKGSSVDYETKIGDLEKKLSESNQQLRTLRLQESLADVELPEIEQPEPVPYKETPEAPDIKYVDDPEDTENNGFDETANVKSLEGTTTTGFFAIPFLGNLTQMFGLGNLFESLIGTSNPFAAFGLTFLASTLYNYFSADDMHYTSIADDITADNIKLLDGIKYTTKKIEVQDTDITLVTEGPFSCFDSFEQTTVDCWDLTFVNEKGIKQEDEQTPIMKILKTESTEHFWREHYDGDYFDKKHGFFDRLLNGRDMDFEKALEELEQEKNEINQYHRLQFNSWDKEDTTTGTQNAYGSCQIGELTGKTGEQALPKIKLEWKWDSIAENACDESNESYIYCDATQFSIELLQKIMELTGELENNPILCNQANCEYTTIQLPKLIAAIEADGEPVNNKDRLIELTTFNAYLIKDGYSKDFQEDFHDYAINTAFFDAPTEYYNKEEDIGIGKYFKDKELFEFDYDGAPNEPLLHPGLYKVEIDITYEDSSWQLFKGNEPNAKIKVNLNRLNVAEPNSPLYYLPFDGEIGIFSDNGRIGYGLDYVNEVGETIKINDGSNSIRTVPLDVADPVEELRTVYETNFKKTNMDQRAKIMQFERTSTSTKLTYTPSTATPVLLEVERPEENPKETAYAFYSITIDGQPQNVGSQGITKWSGIEANCKDFEDRSSQDYMETPDLHGLSPEATNAQIPQDKTTAYGWVWKNPIRTGKFWLETLLFTPLDSDSKMHLISSSNNAVIYTPNQSAVLNEASSSTPLVDLTGVTSKQITSIQKVLDLVKTENVCVGGIGNSSYAYFFWNPEKVDDSLDSRKAEVNAKENCILK